MKKLLIAMLGVGLLAGSVTLGFAQEQPKTEEQAKTKKKGKKKAEEKKTEEAPK